MDARKKKETSSLILMIIVAIALVLSIAAPIFYVKQIDQLETGNARLPEILLSPLLILGVIALIVSLVFTAFVFQQIGLADEKGTLGLPEGSIRAVIALSLILIFMISSVFIFWRMRSYEHIWSFNITRDMIIAFPSESIASIRHNNVNETLFDVERLIGPTQASVDIAKQIITTVSTLVVAVAGFYFGTRAVSTASGVTAISDPVIRKIDPPEGAQGDTISLMISGKNLGLGEGGTVKLVSGDTEMQIKDITSSSTSIACKLIIDPKHGKDSKWSVVVINADEADRR